MSAGRSVRTSPAVLRVHGDLDVVEAPHLQAQLRAHADRSAASVLVVDLSAVSFMDLAGYDVLAGAHTALAADDRLLSLQALTPPVQVLFRALHGAGTFALVVQTLGDRPRRDSPGAPVGTSAQPGRAALAAQMRELRASLATRAQIEQARGLLMGLHGCDARQAGLLLALIAAHRGVTVPELAAGLAAAAAGAVRSYATVTGGGPVDEAVRSALGHRAEAGPSLTTART